MRLSGEIFPLNAHLLSHRQAQTGAMKSTEFWFWLMTDQWGRRRKSPCRYREADALQRDPTATRVEGSCELRDCPETLDENYSLAPTNKHLTGHDWRGGNG